MTVVLHPQEGSAVSPRTMSNSQPEQLRAPCQRCCHQSTHGRPVPRRWGLKAPELPMVFFYAGRGPLRFLEVPVSVVGPVSATAAFVERSR